MRNHFLSLVLALTCFLAPPARSETPPPPASCQLVGLFPGSVTLPQPGPGRSYAIYNLSGFSESGIQAYIRLVPPLGLAMSRSRLPLDQVEQVAEVSAILANALGNQVDLSDIFALIRSLR